MRHLGCRKLADAEFYLNFIIHWFYGDFALVSALLDEDKDLSPFNAQSILERDAINFISTIFQQRFAALFTELTVEMVERFDELMVRGDKMSWWEIQIGTVPAQAKAIEIKLIADVNHLVDYSRPGTDEQRAVRSMCYDNMLRRNYMCIGSFAEHIEILANGNVNIGRADPGHPFPVMRLVPLHRGFDRLELILAKIRFSHSRCAPRALVVSFRLCPTGQNHCDEVLVKSRKPGPWQGMVTFDILQSGRNSKVFFAVYADKELIVLDNLADWLDEERTEIESINVSTDHCRIAKTIMRNTIKKALDADRSSAVYQSFYRTQSKQTTEAMYRNWSGALMTVTGPEAVLSKKSGTFLKICGFDTKFLRTLAALGCIGSPFISQNDLEQICEINGFTAAQFQFRIETVKKKHKFQFMYQLGDHFVLTI